MKITFGKFSGELPQVNDKTLPDVAASSAINANFEAGTLRPWFGYTAGPYLGGVLDFIRSIHLWTVAGTGYWLRFDDYVNVVRSPVADDAYRRIYWSGDTRLDDCLLYSYTPAVYTGGTEYPVNYFKLGIPAPTIAPTTTLVTSIPDGATTEARSYVYTYVGKMGEESAPSPPSDILICPAEGATVNVNSLTVDVSASTSREIVSFRLYRVATGSSGNAEYLFVDEIDIAYALPYADTLDTSELSETLETTAWSEPREGLTSLGITGSGVAYAVTGKILAFSVPYIPYAWPREYELTGTYDAVAVGHYDSYIVVATKGRPMLVTGIDPSNMSQQDLPLNEACVSARSLVSFGYGVMYASPNGLVLATGGSASLITEGIITDREWSLLEPSSIHACEHRGRYVFFWYVDSGNNGGYIFDPRRPELGLVALGRWFVATHRDMETDTLWMVDDSRQLWSLDDMSDTPDAATWASKTVVLPVPRTFAAARVLADSYADISLTVTADGATFHTQAVTDANAFRLPQGERLRNWSVSVTTQDEIREIAIAESLTELKS